MDRNLVIREREGRFREGRRNNEREVGCGGQNSRFLELTMKDDKKKSKVLKK